MSFLEFFEALIGCAEKYVTLSVVKDPSTPRPSTSVTKDESMYSIPGSPSRLTSQVICYMGCRIFVFSDIFSIVFVKFNLFALGLLSVT